MGLLVACVGIPTNTPSAPNRRGSTSAATSAASVFPSPIGASMIIRPGAGISSAIATARACASRESRPNHRRIRSRSPPGAGALGR